MSGSRLSYLIFLELQLKLKVPCHAMRIITWNVNGLRAIHRKNEFLPFIEKHKPDVLCLQETKASPEQLSDELLNIKGYDAHFASSKIKKGYSGVTIYSKIKTAGFPDDISTEIGLEKFDEEGRFIEAHYGDIILLNIYFPNGGQGPHRLEYKLEFYEYFLKYIDRLKEKNKQVIFCGDVNTAHKEIDLARPKENVGNTGFLPIERKWMDKLVKHEWIDVFRYFYPDVKNAYTYWDMKSFARDRNVGWRIDYFFASPNVIEKIKDIKILSDVYGSDHAPVELTLS